MSVAMTKADRITALVLFALGAAMFAGGYTMDRLEIRQIHPASIPGLVPMILGALLMLCAAMLYRGARAAGAGGERFMEGGNPRRLLATAALCIVYAVLLVGWLPYWLATSLFVAAFSLVFGFPRAGTGAAKLRAVALALVIALGVAGLVSYMFSEIFLVRLP